MSWRMGQATSPQIGQADKQLTGSEQRAQQAGLGRTSVRISGAQKLPFTGFFAGGTAGGAAGYPGGGFPGGAGGGAGGYPGGGYPGGRGGGNPYDVSIQTNPYQKEAFQMYRDLLGQINEWRKQTPDATGALQNYRDLMAGTMSEIGKQGAMRGFGGDSGINKIQQLQAAREGRAGAEKLSYDWLNRAQELGLQGLQALAGGIGGMAGLGTNIAGAGTDWYRAVSGAQNARDQNQIAWYKAINDAQWQPLQFIGGLIGALKGLV